MINVAKLLKDAPEGMKLCSPLFGNVELSEVRIGNDMPIHIKRGFGIELFDEYGRYYKGFPDAECVLFPSKDCRTWEGWKHHPVEHQYKVHDCVVSNGQPAIIYELKKDYYLGKYLNGHDFCHKYADEDKLHLWTIQDAKDGDVLCTKSGKCPFIYDKGRYNNGLCYYYAGIDAYGKFVMKERKTMLSHFGSGVEVAPATKEQRELLFAKMKEAGYEWDADKKELKKVSKHYDISNFHAGMPVLVRDNNKEWRYVPFSHITNSSWKFNAVGTIWEQCIPFNDDTKHLLGTTDMCDECYVNW